MTTKLSPTLTNRGNGLSAVNPNDPTDERGRQRILQGLIELAAADLTSGDIVLLAGIPSGASVVRLEIANDDLDTATTVTFNLGLYNDIAGTEAADADVYATAVAQFQAASGFVDLAFEARNIDKTGQQVWQDAGVTSNDNKERFIGITFTATGTTAGTVAYRITYVTD